MIGAKRSQPGYTLIELLVVSLILSMVLIALSQLFVSFGALHRKVANAAIVSEDTRFLMELLVREARNSEIDYPAYGASVPNVGPILRLRKQNGTSLWISQRVSPQSGCDYSLTTSCIALSTNNGVTWSQITSGRINVRAFRVYIQPAVSPFNLTGSGYANNTQPFVTFFFDAEYLAERVKERASLSTQTTVSSRVYRR